jgi:ribosomal-protein-alanine N-acetyltransferase
MMIETKNLRLIPCNREILNKAIEGNNELGSLLDLQIADNWTEFGVEPLKYALNLMLKDQEEIGWLTYFPIHKQDNKLIGSGGYKGKPTEYGTVEIGYEITPAYRNKGFATEMAKGLISNAFTDNSVKLIIAHTLPEENASTKILTRFGFVKTGEIMDPDDGLIWKWELKKDDFNQIENLNC